MTWERVPLVNQRRSAEAENVRISVVLAYGKKTRRTCIALQFPAPVLRAAGWKKGDRIVVDVGLEEHHGAIRLSRSVEPDARALQANTRSSGLRVFLPIFPWLPAQKSRSQEAMETRVAGGAVIVHLPQWARQPMRYPATARRAA